MKREEIEKEIKNFQHHHSMFPISSEELKWAVSIAEHILRVAESKQWQPMSELPPRQEGVSYSQVWCFVIHKGERKILAFNHEHMCWDREDGDDFYCGIHEVTHWMPLPKSPEKN